MSWRKTGLWISIVLVGIVVLASIWVWNTDLGVFKPRIERWGSEMTGRELRIGELSIEVGKRITVIGTDVYFPNAEWAGPEPMVSVGHIKLQVDLGSIFSPTVVIESVEIRDAAIELAIPESGDPNWRLARADEDFLEWLAEDYPEGSLPYLLRDATVSDFRLTYDSAMRPSPLVLRIDSATQHLTSDSYLDLAGTGTLNGRDISVEGEIGTWQSLLDARDIEYGLSGRFDTLTLSVSGRVDDLSMPKRPTMTFEAGGPDIDDLTRMLGLGDEGSGDIAVRGGLEQLDDGMELTLAGNLGETRIDVRADFSSLVDLTKIDAEVRASGPDLSQPMALAGVQGLDSGPFQLIADLQRAGEVLQVSRAEMLYGDMRFVLTANLPGFPALDEGSIELSLQGTELGRLRRLTGLPGVAEGAFSGKAILTAGDGGREFFEVDMETILGRVAASGEIKGGATFLGSTASVELEVYDAAAAARAWQLDIGSIPPERLSASGSFEYSDGALLTTRPLTGSLGNLHAGVEGRIAVAEDGAGSNLAFEVSADRLTRITDPFTDSRFVPPEPFSAKGHVVVEPSAIRLDDLEGTLGTASISGSANIHLGTGIAGSDIRFQASGEALEAILAHIPELAIRPGPFAASGRIRFARDALQLEELDLERPGEMLAGRLSLGLPIERNWFEIEIKARSDDVRPTLRRIPGFEPARAPFAIDLSIERNGKALQVDKVDIAFADARFSAAGPLHLGDEVAMSRLRLTADVPSLASLGTVGEREFEDQAFGFDGLVSGDRGQLRIEDADIRLADSDMKGSISLTTGVTPILRMDVVSERLEVKPLFVRLETGQAKAVVDRTRMIPDIPLPFDELAAVDAYLRVNIAELQRERLYLRDVTLDADIEDGALQLRDLSFHARSGYLRANGRLEPDGGTGRAGLRLLAEQLAFGINQANMDLRGTADIKINLDATGNDLRSLASTASGMALVDIEGGAIPRNRLMQFFYGGVLEQILMTINPFAETDTETVIECIVVPMQLTNGLLTATPAAFARTDKLNVTLKSEVNLANEGLDISVRTTPRRALTISTAEIVNPYVKIVGTMAEPALAVDEKGALITSGAAVATAGLSVLAKAAWDRLSRSPNPCRAARKQASEALSDRYPDIAPLEQLPSMPEQASSLTP